MGVTSTPPWCNAAVQKRAGCPDPQPSTYHGKSAKEGVQVRTHETSWFVCCWLKEKKKKQQQQIQHRPGFGMRDGGTATPTYLPPPLPRDPVPKLRQQPPGSGTARSRSGGQAEVVQLSHGPCEVEICQQGAKDEDRRNTLCCYHEWARTTKLALSDAFPADCNKPSALASPRGRKKSEAKTHPHPYRWVSLGQAAGVKLQRHSAPCSLALAASKERTRFKVTAQVFKIQVPGRRTEGEKRLKVLIKCSLGRPRRKQLYPGVFNNHRGSKPRHMTPDLCCRPCFRLAVEVTTS